MSNYRRYELTSVSSSPGFFTIGVTNTSLNAAGKWPTVNDLLKSSTMNGARRSTVCFRTEVGIGSAADDLSGNPRLRTASMMSSMVSGQRRRSDTPGRARLYMGGEASPVFDRTLTIFLAKNWLNTSTSIAEDAGVRLRPSRASAVFHRPGGSALLACNFLCQNS